MEKYVALAYRDEVPADGLAGNNLPGRGQLFEKLRIRGFVPAVSTGAESAFNNQGEITLKEITDHDSGSTKFLGDVELSHVGLILNRLDRSFKYQNVACPDLVPSLINTNEVRSLAFRKHRMHDEVLDPLGIAIPTRLIETAEDIDLFMEQTDSSRVVVKPTSGSNSKGIYNMARDGVSQHFVDNPTALGTHIIQEAHDFTVPFPKNIRAYDSKSIKAFEIWSRSTVPKELRVYGFHSPTNTTVMPVARAIKDGDNWFFVDPESLPVGLLMKSKMAILRAAAVTGATALYGTVDFGYGSKGESEPDWRVVEMNARMPYLLGYDKHAGIAGVLREMMADQIKDAAEIGS